MGSEAFLTGSGVFKQVVRVFNRPLVLVVVVVVAKYVIIQI